MAAERETVDRLIAHHLADRIGDTFEGRISGVTKAGLFVKLDGTGADGFVPASTIGADYYRFDERSHALRGERTGETYRLGDKAHVKLVEAAPVAGALRFELVTEGRFTGKGRGPRRDRRAGSGAKRAAAPRRDEGGTRAHERPKGLAMNHDPHRRPSTSPAGSKPRGAAFSGVARRAARGGSSAATSRSSTGARSAAQSFTTTVRTISAYLVMIIVGHVVVYGILQTETRLEVPMWVHLAVWPALTVALALALLQPVKALSLACNTR